MKSLSVFQVVILAVFGALALSGILIFALVVSGGGGGTVGPVTIWGTLEPSPFTTVLRQVSENDPRLAQVSYEQKDPETYEGLLTEALASGGGPDLFLLRHDYVVQNSGKAVPIPYELVSRSQFENTFVEAAEVYLDEGGILGVPIASDPLILYWNRDMLSAAGFARPPEHWDQLPDMARKIVKKDEAGRIVKAAVGFGEYQNVTHAKDIMALLTLQAGGTITQKDATGRLLPTLAARTAGAPSQATESALRFYTEFADPSKVDYSWNRSLSETRTAFASGDLALYIGYASEIAMISRMNPNLNFAVAPVPQIRGTERPLNLARVYALAVSRASPRSDSASLVASIMGSADFARSLAIALGMPSARRDVLAEGGSEEEALFVREALISRSWMDPDPQQTNAIFRAMIEGVVSGSSHPAEAIGRANQEIARILEQRQ
jgi:ABC-type glycerol-3-phosphate transport system substrate-binding protein